jgi:hypothetical protein
MATHGCSTTCLSSVDQLFPSSDATDEVMVLESICDNKSFQIFANSSVTSRSASEGSTDIRGYAEARHRLDALLSSVCASSSASVLAYLMLVDVHVSLPPMTAKSLPNTSASALDTCVAVTASSRPNADLGPALMDPTDDGRYPLFLCFDWIDRMAHRSADGTDSHYEMMRCLIAGFDTPACRTARVIEFEAFCVIRWRINR